MRKKLLSGLLVFAMMLAMLPTAFADSTTSTGTTGTPTIGGAIVANYNQTLSNAPWTSYTIEEQSGKTTTAVTYKLKAADLQKHYTGDGQTGVDAQGKFWWLGIGIPQVNTTAGITTTAVVGWGEVPDPSANYQAIADVRTNIQTTNGTTYDTFYWNAGSAAKHQNKGYVSLKYTNSTGNTDVIHTYTVDFSDVTLVKVTPAVSSTTTIANGATDVVVTLTSDKAFDTTEGVKTANYTIGVDTTGLTLDKVELDSSDSANKTAKLTFSGTAAAGTLSITAKKAAFASTEEVDEDSNAVTITVPAATVTPPATSTDATLQGLTLSSGTLSPAFASATESYTATVENSVTSITVTPTVNNAKATVKVNNTAVTSGSASSAINLTEGKNTITVVVTAEDGTTTKTYTITVTRKAAPAATLTATAKGNGNYEVNISALTSDKAVWVVTQITKTVSGTKVYLYSWNEVAQGTSTYKLNVGNGDTLELWVADSTFTIDANGLPSYANLWGRTGSVDLTK